MDRPFTPLQIDVCRQLLEHPDLGLVTINLDAEMVVENICRPLAAEVKAKVLQLLETHHSVRQICTQCPDATPAAVKALAADPTCTPDTLHRTSHLPVKEVLRTIYQTPDEAAKLFGSSTQVHNFIQRLVTVCHWAAPAGPTPVVPYYYGGTYPINGVVTPFKSKLRAKIAQWFQFQLQEGVISDWCIDPDPYELRALHGRSKRFYPHFRVAYPTANSGIYKLEVLVLAVTQTPQQRNLCQEFKMVYPQITLTLIDEAWLESHRGRLDATFNNKLWTPSVNIQPISY